MISRHFNSVFRVIFSLMVIAGLLLAQFANAQPAQAFTPPALQYFYVTLPEDVMLQYLNDIFGATPVSPVRSIISIAIGTTGTVVYYDQWEDGGYDADIANPGANVYNAVTNPDGTQIWGDGVLANGCVPFINNIANPCTLPTHDFMYRGNMITLDNQVTVNGSPGSFSRNPAQIFYDGRDKIAASLPVALARAMWPAGAGSLVADAQGILPTERWGTDFVSPVGENLNEAGSNSYEDVRLLVMAGPGGATVDIDANGDGDLLDATDEDNLVLVEGQVWSVNDAAATVNNANTSVLASARVQVVAGNPVQVTLLTGDVGSTYENRFYNLIPRGDWVSDYYSPVGTPGGAQCTSNYVYNPNAAAITVSYDFLGGASPDYTQVIAADTAAELTNVVPAGSGVRIYTAGGESFLPISMTDCVAGTGSGDIYDWGHELYPVDQLSPELLIGWTPGCTNESAAGTCLEVDGTPNNTKSRSVVWVTPLQNTTIYVDLDGSGISCPSGTGAEDTIPATALQAVQITDDPDNVRDQFDTRAYNNNGGGNYNANWSGNWTEVNDDNNNAAGSIYIPAATNSNLRIRNSGTDQNDYIYRAVNLAGMSFARLSFRSTLANFGTNDEVRVQVSSDGGGVWNDLTGGTFTANGGPTTQVFDISAYATANTRIRFIITQELEGTEQWDIDNVNIDYGPGGRIGDFDMTGSYIRTCDDVLLASAFGQNPALSGSGDSEAMDLGMGIPPYGSQIRITKDADRTFASPGDLVTYNYTVKLIQTFSTAVNNVEVEDDRCSPVTYASGDTANAGYLDPGETWNYTCTGAMYADTTNYALALALYGSDRIRSTPAYDTVLLTSSLGDYVWVDEDGDGDQDAGEPGIPNARVTLTGTDVDGGAVNLTTYTDANGRYIFTDVPPSNGSGYTITVDDTTLPAGLAANPTYDENGVGTPHITSVVLGSDVEYVTADFGYNWTSMSNTNTPTGASTGAIGDRIWADADGDGVQDPGEPGLYNQQVQLLTAGADGIFGTGDDVVAANTTTDYAGNYVFDGLSAGAYAVRVNGGATPVGYTPTGDPDQPGAPCTTCDNRTTTPIILAPGDVYLNADFGYQPDASTGATIGDTLWVDTDRGNDLDAGEPRLANVTVSLIRDLNGNGVWDAGEPIIATDITDTDGVYTFPGVPVADGVGTDDYLVWVNDTANVLSELRATYDNDGAAPASGLVTGLGISAVADLTPSGDLAQDFAYAPASQDALEALVGDTVWLDQDGDNTYDPGEGIEGVIVNIFQDTDGDGIYESGEPFLGRVTTNENGQYLLGGLAAGTYTIDIDTATLPNYGTTLTNFADPDGGTPHRAVVTLAAGDIRLDQDFGYRNTSGYTIGGTLWRDYNPDGTLDADGPDNVSGNADDESGRFAGVTIALYTDSNDNGVWDAEDELVGTQITDASGNYNFTGLPNDRYFVDVTDDANLLDGYWHSTGTSPGADNNSQSDYYTVVLAGANNTTGDFGYYRDPAVIGDQVWNDLDGDGIQDAGEPGIPGVIVSLTITWPGGAGTTTLATTTDANGYYTFGNLLSDEDLDGADAGEPTFAITITPPNGYSVTLTDQGGNDNLDSDGTTITATPLEGVTNTSYDAGLVLNAVIGDRVWLDEDSDGVQDAGESGIPNVVVELQDGVCTPGVTCQTTRTDSQGNYLFTDVAPGNYTVAVIGGLPAGLSTNPTYDEDGIGTANASAVTLDSGQEYVTADFGYNWATTSDVTNPGGSATGAIGDRIWADANGDGVQDLGEPGLDGISVDLLTAGADGIFGTGDDVVAANTTTDYAGNYVFDGLSAGAYAVRVNGGATPTGYTPTGDPDQPGALCTTCDNRTTAPIILAPGDVYLNADFGYQPDASTGATIGDTLWVDSNLDNILDGGEPVLPGVTVALIRDLNGDGVWDAGEPIIATDITDANGNYAFTGVPVADGVGTDDYLIWVNDTANVLEDLVANYDADGVSPATGLVTGLGISAVADLTPAGNLNQDFSYVPVDHPADVDSNDGLIGDTIYLDRDGGNDYDPGEGLEGVTVNLYSDTNADGNYDAGEPLVASATTDENGLYFFTDLPAGDYVVMVDTSTLPAGLTNTVDPDTSNSPANESGLSITANGINLTQDFGYDGSNTIGGTIWRDTNADGTLDADGADNSTPTEDDEPGISGITVVLRDSNGDIIATTTTDGSGNYTFSNLPNGTYTVDVTDETNLLDGYWHSTGTSPGADNNSQSDPYTVSVTGGQTDTTADYGYYRDPANLGNFVWLDVDGDGIQDAAEPGLPDVVVTLTVEYPNGSSTTLTTRTDANGNYTFSNLLLDEHFTNSAAGDPTVTLLPRYTISVNTSQPALAGVTTTTLNAGDGSNDSDDPAGAIPTAQEGQTNDLSDFGFDGDVDAGNLPNTFNTLFENNGPGHVLGSVNLGADWDADTNGAPGTTPADNDGITRQTGDLWTPGNTVNLDAVLTGGGGYLVAWFDWNGNNQFDAGENHVFGAVAAGTNTLSLTIPMTYVTATPLPARFRLYETTPADPQFVGTVVGGEVEDYLWSFDPTAVTLISLNAAPSTTSSLWLLIAALMLTTLGGTLALAYARRKQ